MKNSFFFLRPNLYIILKKKKGIPVRNEIFFFSFLFPFTYEINWYFLDLYPSELTGLEPAASALTGRCSDQLNYNPRERGVQYTYFYGFFQTLFFFYFGFEPFCCKWKRRIFVYIDWYLYRYALLWDRHRLRAIFLLLTNRLKMESMKKNKKIFFCFFKYFP